MGILAINDIRLYSYHGCLEEEACIGANYTVDVKIDADFSKAQQSDKLKDTVDYCMITDIVKQEMNTRSNLIENVAYRILTKLKAEIRNYRQIKIRVTKISPPVNADVGSVSIILTSD